MIEEVKITIYKTKDGRTFYSRDEAEEHLNKNEVLTKIVCFSQSGKRVYVTTPKQMVNIVLLKNTEEVEAFAEAKTGRGLNGPGLYRWESYVGWTKLPDIMFKAMLQYVETNSV